MRWHLAETNEDCRQINVESLEQRTDHCAVCKLPAGGHPHYHLVANGINRLVCDRFECMFGIIARTP